MAEHRWYGPGSHFLNLAPDDVHNPSKDDECFRLLHPFVGYDRASAQVSDDGPARVRGSGGDDGGGSGGGGSSDCAFLRTLRSGTPANRLADELRQQPVL